MSEQLFKSTIIVSIMTFLSRITGFARDIIIARLFGAGFDTDIFFMAFKIPNFLRRLSAEGAFSQAFIPILAEYKQRDNKNIKRLIANTSGTLAGVLLIITIIGVFSAPVLVMIFAPGFIDNETKINLAGDLLMITFPYLFFISLTALAGSILNSFGKFAVPAFTPVLLNLSLLACAIWISPQLKQPVIALAWGVFLGGVLQLLFQIPFLINIQQMPKPHWGWNDSGVQKILKLMLPAIFGVSVSQINLLLDIFLASFLITGSISWLYYSDRIVAFPLGIIGIALATVILPSLSRQYAAKSGTEFSHTIDWALRLVLIIGIPAEIGIIWLAEPLLFTLFQYGKFSPEDAHQASLSLIAYGLGLLPFIFIKVLAPSYFARQDIKTPVKFGIVTMITNIVLNIILMLQFAHIGLAVATALSATLNASLLFAGLRKLGIYQPDNNWGRFMVQLFLANVSLLILLVWLTPASITWVNWDSRQRFSCLLSIIGAVILCYLSVLAILGVKMKHLLLIRTK